MLQSLLVPNRSDMTRVFWRPMWCYRCWNSHLAATPTSGVWRLSRMLSIVDANTAFLPIPGSTTSTLSHLRQYNAAVPTQHSCFLTRAATSPSPRMPSIPHMMAWWHTGVFSTSFDLSHICRSGDRTEAVSGTYTLIFQVARLFYTYNQKSLFWQWGFLSSPMDTLQIYSEVSSPPWGDAIEPQARVR